MLKLTARAAAVCAGLFMVGAAPAPGPAPVPLKVVAAAGPDVAKVCALPGLVCGPKRTVALYRAATDPADVYWAIADERPAIAQVQRASTGWALKGAWDLSAYGRVPGGAGDGAESTLKVHPALYPIGPGAWAVAVTHTRTEGYSGGGADFESADFVPLADGPPRPLYKDVPFSCSKMIRACFSERDYKTSAHCHDESEGWLTLAIAPSPAGGRYRWQATWHERLWPSAKPQSASRTRAAPIDLSGKGPAASFCDADG